MVAETIVQTTSITERRVAAERHVELGRRIVERQNEIIAQKRAAHMNTNISEELLGAFIASLKIFEDDLARLIKIEDRQA